MTDANYRDDQTEQTDQTDDLVDRPGQRPPPQTNDLVDRPGRPGSTQRLLADATAATPPTPPTATPPPAFQAPPDQPNRVGPDQSPHGGLPPAGSPGAQPAVGPGPFGPYGMPQFRGHARQTYIPAMANRMPHEWGGDRRFPMMPKPWEVPGIYRGLGRKLSQWGPGFVAPFAAMMGQHSGAWMKGYMQGQEQLARLQHQRMSMAAEETERRMGTMMREYQQIHAIFGDDPKNAGKLDQALRNAAQKYQDDHMLGALDTVGHEGAMGLLKWYDAQHSDLRAGNRARQTDEKRREDLSPYQLDPTDAAGLPRTTPPPDATPPDTSATPPAASPDSPRPDTGAPADSGTPTSGNPDVDSPGLDPISQADQAGDQTQQADAGDDMTPEQKRFLQTATAGGGTSDAPDPAIGRLAQAGQPQRQAAPVPEADEVLPQYDPQNSPVLTQAANGPDHLNNRGAIDAEAQNMVMGTSKMTQKHPVWNVANARAKEIQQKLDGVLRSNLTGKGVYDEIRKVLPRFADQLQQYVSGASPVPSGARNQPINAYILSLGHKADPGWNEQTAKVRFTNMRDWTAGPAGRQWLSQITAMDHLDHLKELSAKLPDWYWYVGKSGAQRGQNMLDNLPGWLLKNVLPGQLDEDRRNIRAYEATLQLVAPEIERAQKGAAGTQKENEHFVNTMGASESPRTRDDIIESARSLIWNRAHNQIQQKAAAMGTTPERLLAPYDRFRAGGGVSDNGKAEDGSAGNAPVPPRAGFDAGATARGFITKPYPPGARAPDTGAPSAAAPGAPAVGAIQDGYRFKGGNPGDPKNWEKQ